MEKVNTEVAIGWTGTGFMTHKAPVTGYRTSYMPGLVVTPEYNRRRDGFAPARNRRSWVVTHEETGLALTGHTFAKRETALAVARVVSSKADFSRPGAELKGIPGLAEEVRIISGAVAK